MKKMVMIAGLLLAGLVLESAAGVPPGQEAFSASTDRDKALAVIQDQITALKTGDSSKAYYAYTTKGFRTSFSLEQYKSLVKRFKVFAQVRMFQSEDFAFEGTNVVKVRGKLISSDGDSMRVSFDVVLEDNEWKIQNIQMTQAMPKYRATPHASGPRVQTGT